MLKRQELLRQCSKQAPSPEHGIEKDFDSVQYFSVKNVVASPIIKLPVVRIRWRNLSMSLTIFDSSLSISCRLFLSFSAIALRYLRLCMFKGKKTRSLVDKISNHISKGNSVGNMIICAAEVLLRRRLASCSTDCIFCIMTDSRKGCHSCRRIKWMLGGVMSRLSSSTNHWFAAALQ
jgi:hypothetical protein